MIEILFDKSKETEAVIRHGSISCDVGVSIRVDGEPVLREVELNGFRVDLINNFFYYCLWYPQCLHSGNACKYEFSESMGEKLLFEPLGDRMAMRLQVIGDDTHRVYGKKFEVRLKDFAIEAIKSAEEFAKYALDIEPRIVNDVHLKIFYRNINNARTWFCRTYGEKI